MSLFQFEESLIGNKQSGLKMGERLTIRRQQCRKCNHVLALELAMSGELGHGGDHYVVDGCAWLEGEPHLTYKKKRWFGNFVRCPVCGSEGRLPIDKPLAWEQMQQRKDQHAVQSN